MSQISLSVGNQIEDYECLDELGKGGFATVYRARCSKSGFEVALKVINKNILKKEMIVRVKQEVSIHSKLKHPSILEMYTFFEDVNNVYMVLEMAQKGDLQRFLRDSQRKMSEAETAIILTPVVKGLVYLKAHNIVHRDMSLSNLLLTDDFKVKIADFGFAVELNHPDEKHMTLCGTPNYISPEVASRSSHGLPADVFGLGSIMYALLVGKPPFDSNGVKSTLTRVVMDDFVRPAFLSMEAKDLLNRLLTKNDHERLLIEDVLSHPFMMKHNKASVPKYNMNTIASVDSGLMTMSSGALSTQNLTAKIFDQSRFRFDATRSNALTPNRGQLTSNGVAAEQNFFRQNEPQQHDDDDAIAKIFAKIEFLQRQPSPNTVNRNDIVDKQPTNRNDGGFGQQHEAAFFTNGENQNVAANGQRFMHILPKPQTSNTNGGGTEKTKSPPLTSIRLMQTRHKARNVILSILANGEVVVELIKFKSKYNEERVIEVCRISSDGLRIVTYQPDAGRGSKIQDSPAELPESGADSIYSYENLPSKHWKKYTYAYRFVQMVRGKTPKVTYYSPQAKCQLMETVDDFEVVFYDGTKLSKSANGQMKAIDDDGQQLELSRLNNPHDDLYSLHAHFQQCLEHCQNLERLLSDVRTDGECFPVTIGRRPALAPVVSSNSNLMTPKLQNMPSFATSINSILSTRPQSAQSKSSPMFHTPVNRVKIPGVGIASQTTDGVVEVTYPDGSRLSVIQPHQGGGITYTHTNGSQTHFTATDKLPDTIRERLTQMSTVVEHLMNHNANAYQNSPILPAYAAYPCTPLNQKCAQSNSSQNKRYFR